MLRRRSAGTDLVCRGWGGDQANRAHRFAACPATAGARDAPIPRGRTQSRHPESRIDHAGRRRTVERVQGPVPPAAQRRRLPVSRNWSDRRRLPERPGRHNRRRRERHPRGDLQRHLPTPTRQALVPGTHRVTVAVYDIGRAGVLHHPPKPFGAATFTVRPSGRTALRWQSSRRKQGQRPRGRSFNEPSWQRAGVYRVKLELDVESGEQWAVR
jgi:hypothetical protein